MLLALEVRVGRLGEPAGVFEELPRRQVVVLLLEALDLAVELLRRETLAQDPGQEVLAADRGAGNPDPHAVPEEPVREEQGAEAHDPGHVRVVEKAEEESHRGPVTLPASVRRSGISRGL